MNQRLLVAFASTAVAALMASAASAAPILDTYHGGQSDFNGGVVDVVGNPNSFNIISIDLSRSGNNLTAIIHTNYADALLGLNGRNDLGTGMGALFFGPPSALTLNVDGGAQALGSPYNYDTWRADTDRFTYAFQPSDINGSSAGTLYQLPNASAVQQSYFPTIANTTGANFREGQAVGVKTANAVSTGKTGNVVVDGTADTITFNINDFFSIAALNVPALTVAWAMTCANDVILVDWVDRERAVDPTPLPGALALFLGGGGILGFLGTRRRRAVKPA